MKLDIQIYSLIYSFIFGIFFYYSLFIFNKIICQLKRIIIYIVSVIYVVSLALLYFFGLLYINNGFVHFYFIIMLLLGYILGFLIVKFYFTYKIKKKNVM